MTIFAYNVLYTLFAVNKTQLIEAMVLDSDLTKIEARKAVDSLIRVMQQTLAEGDHITLSGLGTFSVHHHAERMGRNPRTGAAVPIPAHRSVKFRSLVDLD